jgi:pSer/pThr/pTyr-binding forkhead associated (FHA) protein
VELSGPHSASAAELKQRLEAERVGRPFLVLRDGTGAQKLLQLDPDAAPLTVGRSSECAVPLSWDDEVSRVHAELVHLGGGWAIDDGGLSRNGSFVNGERLQERRRLRDGDTMRFGRTAVLYRQPQGFTGERTTVLAHELPGPADVSGAQRAVLRALCRPFAEGANYARPATNAQIAEELVLSLDAIKGHLRVLFAKFEVEDLPQNEKRLRLAERALTSGAVNLNELRRDVRHERT